MLADSRKDGGLWKDTIPAALSNRYVLEKGNGARPIVVTEDAVATICRQWGRSPPWKSDGNGPISRRDTTDRDAEQPSREGALAYRNGTLRA